MIRLTDPVQKTACSPNFSKQWNHLPSFSIRGSLQRLANFKKLLHTLQLVHVSVQPILLQRTSPFQMYLRFRILPRLHATPNCKTQFSLNAAVAHISSQIGRKGTSVSVYHRNASRMMWTLMVRRYPTESPGWSDSEISVKYTVSRDRQMRKRIRQNDDCMNYPNMGY